MTQRIQQPYRVPKDTIEHSIEVNKSHFICTLARCQSSDACKSFISSIRDKYPDASHHCVAFVYDRPDNSQSYGFSDDGEPSGTAGRPMLAVLQGAEIGEICAVVTRYFGGTKLGTGGLQRAYGGSVREALLHLQTDLIVPSTEIGLFCGYQQFNDIEHCLKRQSGHIVTQEFLEQIKLTVSLPMDKLQRFKDEVIQLTSGQIQFADE
ncbi:YigZ family protein [Thalassotalea litorea]|uniref:YigZ family protein n=1 Tax=Thalassotalea litorea TaxID=2020715 RepID=A0A5R9ITW5_9GAMM|nr:YigZ family protein [Thalassotalea litorea]TLU65378.1 YigZ family protein [Thalassotalea litorea]